MMDAGAAIAERLRECYDKRELPTWGEMRKAADEIERLHAELHSVHAHLNYLRSKIDLLRKVRDIADLLVNECEGGRNPPSLGILARLESALAMEHKARSE
jgi:hypothetical protein